MKPLLPILRATHCRSTHHCFALDALPVVQTESGKRLVRWLLRYHKRYLRGATDPDIRFRDFQNHVIHVDDGYWGGAPRVAHQWYDRLQRYLRQGRFSDAAHAAGVISHYFTDPIQPLHTAHTHRGAVVHRPIEWTIVKSYDTIYRRWIDDEMRVVFQLSDGPGWLGEAMLHGARFANRKYQRLIDSYRLDQSIQNPRDGLDAESRALLAELFGLSITGWARILERAAIDAEAARGAPLPPTSLVGATLSAIGRVPDRLWLRWIEGIEEQVAINALYDEFQRTGSIQNHLPAEVDILQRVTKVYHDEKRWRDERRRRLQSKAVVIDVETRQAVPQEPEMPATIPFATRDPSRGRLSPHDPSIDAPSIDNAGKRNQPDSKRRRSA